MLLINALNMLTIDLSLHIALLGVSLIRKLALINLLNYLEKKYFNINHLVLEYLLCLYPPTLAPTVGLPLMVFKVAFPRTTVILLTGAAVVMPKQNKNKIYVD